MAILDTRPDELEQRADSPMREDPINPSDSSQVNGNPPHGLPLPRSQPPSTGFTAVNGDRQRNTSFRPDDAAGASIASPVNDSTHDTIVVATNFPSHGYGWRPTVEGDRSAELVDSQQQDAATNKRKRSDSPHRRTNGDGHVDEPGGHRGESPKRRHVQSLVDSAVDLTSPDRDSHAIPVVQKDRRSDTAPGAPDERKTSPNPRRSQMEPPPRPRPETEAMLAESVIKFQQSQQNQQSSPTRQTQSAPVDDPSPPRDEDDEHPLQTEDEDQMQDSFSMDPKRRKRNFSNRTKSGCHTCRSRKKKCDEGKPNCKNCERGGFQCSGYGPKPPNFKPPGQSRNVVPLQSKPQPYEQSHGPTGYWHPPPPIPPPQDDGRQYGHWGHMGPEIERTRHFTEGPTMDPRHHNDRDPWPKSTWHPPEAHPPPYFPERVPPADFPFPRPQAYPPDPFHQPPMSLQPSAPPPPAPLEHWPHNPPFPPYRHQTGPPTMISSRDSVTTTSSHRGAHLINFAGSQYAEKEKMLRGQNYLHYIDNILIKDRAECHKILAKWNKATEKQDTATERATLFEQILQPHRRPYADKNLPDGPTGSIKDHTLVEGPFTCDFGYHLHLGKDTVIQPRCIFHDAGGIWIGDRVIVGSDVKLITMTTSNDCTQRRGSQGLFKAGAIHIEDDVYIGANVTVLPYVTIRKGAVVGAGSVVTRVRRPPTSWYAIH